MPDELIIIMYLILGFGMLVSLGLSATVDKQFSQLKDRLKEIESITKMIDINEIRSMNMDDKIFSLLQMILKTDEYNKYDKILNSGMHLTGRVKLKDDIYDQSTEIEFMTDLNIQEVINICYYRLDKVPTIKIIKDKSGTGVFTYIIKCDTHKDTQTSVVMLSHAVRDIYGDEFRLSELLESKSSLETLPYKLGDYSIIIKNYGANIISTEQKIQMMLEEIDKNV